MKLLNLLGCTGSSVIACDVDKPTTKVNAEEDVDYKNAGFVARAYMGRPVPTKQGSYRDINCLYMKDGKLWER